MFTPASSPRGRRNYIHLTERKRGNGLERRPPVGTARLRRANTYLLQRRDGATASGSTILPGSGTSLRPFGPRADLEVGVPSRRRHLPGWRSGGTAFSQQLGRPPAGIARRRRAKRGRAFFRMARPMGPVPAAPQVFSPLASANSRRITSRGQSRSPHRYQRRSRRVRRQPRAGPTSCRSGRDHAVPGQ